VTAELPSAEPRVSVVIPALNEARNLEHVFAALPAGLLRAAGTGRSGEVTRRPRA
jgi:hypothetical protein